MQSGSQTTSPSGRSVHATANIFGTAIALLTLILPIFVIAHYTSSSPPPLESTSVVGQE